MNEYDASKRAPVSAPFINASPCDPSGVALFANVVIVLCITINLRRGLK